MEDQAYFTQLDDTMARCIGLPASRTGILTGEDQAGELFTYSSPDFTGPYGPGPAGSDPPDAQSYVEMVSSTSTERHDLAALSRRTAPSCLQALNAPIEHALDPTSEIIPARRVSVPVIPRVSVVAIQTGWRIGKSGGYATIVVMGAGRMEISLRLFANSTSEAGQLTRTLVPLLEHRLAARTS